MPRTARRDAPGAIHHVMMRGVARCDVFRDDHDRLDFRNRLARLLREEHFRCFAWAFMPNHVHLLVQTGPSPLARLMARLGTGYAGYHNKRHDRAGHLFQNRYKALSVSDDAYAQVLVAYICANPLAGGRVRDVGELEFHPWTALPELLGRHPGGIVDVDRVLGWFGPTPGHARAQLRRRLVAPAVPAEAPSCKTHGSDALGKTLGSDALGKTHGSDALASPSPALEGLIVRLCAERGLSATDLNGRSRRPGLSEARAALVDRAHTELGVPLAVIERRLGWSSGAASKALARARRGRAGQGGVSPWSARQERPPGQA